MEPTEQEIERVKDEWHLRSVHRPSSVDVSYTDDEGTQKEIKAIERHINTLLRMREGKVTQKGIQEEIHKRAYKQWDALYNRFLPFINGGATHGKADNMA